FLPALAIAFAVSGAAGALLERVLYRRLYRAAHLDQVLFTIGLTFMSMAAATYGFGPAQQPVHLPPLLTGQVHVFGLDLGTYRLFLMAMVVLATLSLTYLVERTRFGAQVRAAVDNPQAAVGLGIDVLGLDPTFPLKYMVYFLLVVAVGGAGTIRGPLLAALLLGICDVAGKYYVPQIGSFVIYAVMVVLLL